MACSFRRVALAAVLGSVFVSPVAAANSPHTRNVAIVVYDGVEVLDFAGPGEVFQAAARYAGMADRPGFRVYTVGPTKEPIVSQGFVRVTPEFSVDDAERPDILVLPGGNSGRLTGDPHFMAWVTKAMSEAEVTLTVCTGAFVAAKAGVLDGRAATTWYGAVEGLRKAAPKTSVQEGRRFIDSGSVVTTAGVSAGIDGALHVVARLVGRSAADRTARYMEYHWAPEPYLDLHYSQLNPDLDEAGRAIQPALLHEYDRDFEGAAAAWRAILDKDPGNGTAWYRLGLALHSLGRYDDAAVAAERATKSPAIAPKAFYNLACARALQGRPSEAIAALEKAVEAGYRGKQALEADSDLEAIRSEGRFKALLARLSE